jgi:hypothetical protein
MSDRGLAPAHANPSHVTDRSPTPATAAGSDEQQARKRTARACDSCYKRKVCIFRFGNVQVIRIGLTWACRLNVMRLFRNVTGAVIIISRVPLRGLYSGGGKIGGMALGMFAFLFLWQLLRCRSRPHKTARLSERLSRIEKLLMENFSGESRRCCDYQWDRMQD